MLKKKHILMIYLQIEMNEVTVVCGKRLIWCNLRFLVPEKEGLRVRND